jgi:dTDP-4-amino-4,6-dideoxygalactose transaminase
VPRALADLAIFGGRPAFAEPLHVGRPNIGDEARLIARLRDMLGRRWLTNHGPYVEELERRIAAVAGVAHCIATCNATVGLEVAIRALGITGEVIVPSFTFVATVHALEWLGVTPIFCDIDPATHNLDPRLVEPLIGPRTGGILGVHVWGRGSGADELETIARRHGLPLLFDAAHAFACTHRGRPIGTFGNAEVLSFHATKFLNSFEGGAIVTNDGVLAERVRLMTNFGFADIDHVVSLGTNAKMHEMSAAMGLTSLEAIEGIVEANLANHRRYAEQLAGIPGITLVRYDPAERNNHQYVVIEIDDAAAGVTRDEVHAVLRAEQVLARRYFYPACHRMEPYRSRDPAAAVRLPATEALTERVLQLPTGTALGSDEIDTIADTIRVAVESASEVRTRLRAAPAAHG